MLSMILNTASKMPLMVGTECSGFLGLGGPLLIKYTQLARLLAWETERYDASEYMADCIQLSLYYMDENLDHKVGIYCNLIGPLDQS